MSATSSRERRRLVGRSAGHGLGVGDRLAGVAERLVDRVREGVHGRRLRLARDDEARCRGAPSGPRRRPRRRDPSAPPPAIAPTATATARGEGLDLGGRHRPPVVGARARQRRRRLDDVEAVGALGRCAARRSRARSAAWPGPRRGSRPRARGRRRPCRRRTAARRPRRTPAARPRRRCRARPAPTPPTSPPGTPRGRRRSASASVGEVTVPVRNRRPAPRRGRSFSSGELRRPRGTRSTAGSRPRSVSVCERSGSYMLRIEACAKTSVPPRLAGWSSLPSILVGRPS